MNSMRAVIQGAFGAPEILETVETEAPGKPQADEVVIRVEGCGVCYHDVLVRRGTFRQLVNLPVIPGHELAGEAVAVGADVRRVRVGDRVASTNRQTCGQCRWCRTGHEAECRDQGFFGHNIPGGYAEYVKARENALAVVPPSIPSNVASFLSCAVGTELHALVTIAGTKVGDTVVVTGAGGGLGVQGVQLARLCGADVIAVTTSEEKAPALKRYGANEVLVVRRGERFDRRLKEIAPRGADVICDNVGEPVFDSCFPALAVDGRYVFVGQVNDRPVTFNPAWVLLHETRLMGSRSSTLVELEEVIRLVDSGRLDPVLEAEIPLEEAADAHALIERGSMLGRFVLVP